MLSPVALAYSRYQEHEADRFALDLTRDNRSVLISFVEIDGREPEQSAPRADLQVLPIEPPEHRRANRLLQQLSPLALEQTTTCPAGK